MLSKYLKRTFIATLIRIADVLGIVFIAYFFIDENAVAVNDYQISLVVVTCAVLSVIVMSVFSVYLSWRVDSFFKLVRRVFVSWTLVFAMLVIGIFLYKIINDVSRLWLFKWYASTLFYFIAVRLAGYYFIRQIRAMGRNTRFLRIVGESGIYSSVIGTLDKHPEMGYKLVGIFSCDHGACPNSDSYLKFVDACNTQSPDELWIALPMERCEDVKKMLADLHNCTANIRWIPDISDSQLLKMPEADIAGHKIINLAVSPFSDPVNRFAKRVEDIVLSLMIIVIISPVLLLTALAVKLTSRGPILFRQDRHGIMGKVISVYKFRSMYVHKEDGDHVTQATKDDPRITPVGAFIRRTSIDELPQFFNVLLGDMSIVGPRPHAVAHDNYYKQYIESYMQRHKVKPGITGWAQVNGWRGETDTMDKMEKRVEFDLYYIDNWSVIFDLKIVFMTIFKGFVNKNAY